MVLGLKQLELAAGFLVGVAKAGDHTGIAMGLSSDWGITPLLQ
jgi:hypothetical protein